MHQVGQGLISEKGMNKNKAHPGNLWFCYRVEIQLQDTRFPKQGGINVA